MSPASNIAGLANGGSAFTSSFTFMILCNRLIHPLATFSTKWRVPTFFTTPYKEAATSTWSFSLPFSISTVSLRSGDHNRPPHLWKWIAPRFNTVAKCCRRSILFSTQLFKIPNILLTYWLALHTVLWDFTALTMISPRSLSWVVAHSYKLSLEFTWIRLFFHKCTSFHLFTLKCICHHFASQFCAVLPEFFSTGMPPEYPKETNTIHKLGQV